MNYSKTCPMCAKVLPLSLFGKNAAKSDRVQSYCKSCRLSYDKSYRSANSRRVSEVKKRYTSKESTKIKRNQYRRRKRKTSIEFRLKETLRSRLNSAIRTKQKTGSAVHDLGCSIESLISHIESQFKPGMTWDNWGKKGWHIDHIKPLSKFNLENSNDLKKASHFSNLQPLWSIENQSKGGR